jgi:hypothetical protein
MRKISFFILIISSLAILSACVTKTVLVKCPDSGAKITVDGDYAGDQQTTFKVKLTGWKNVTVSAPKYISESFTIKAPGSSITEVCLEPDPNYEERDYTINTVPSDATITIGGEKRSARVLFIQNG